jgi:hypothetical protein
MPMTEDILYFLRGHALKFILTGYKKLGCCWVVYSQACRWKLVQRLPVFIEGLDTFNDRVKERIVVLILNKDEFKLVCKF